MVKIDSLTAHKEVGYLHFILKAIFHCIFIEKPCIFFPENVQIIMKVQCILYIIEPKFVKTHETNERDSLYSEATIQFPQICSESLSQLAYNLFEFINGF